MKKLSQKEITKKFDDFAKHYEIGEIIMNLILARYRKRLLKDIKGKILEVGIGTGANLKYYSKDCEICGIDTSKEMLAKANKKAIELNKKINLKIANAEKLPFKNKEFDFVIDTLCLCVYPFPINALKEMKRVCKKNGRILLLEHGISSNSFIRKLQEKRELKHYQKIGCSLLRNHEQLAKTAGLKIEKIERKFFGIVFIITAV